MAALSSLLAHAEQYALQLLPQLSPLYMPAATKSDGISHKGNGKGKKAGTATIHPDMPRESARWCQVFVSCTDNEAPHENGVVHPQRALEAGRVCLTLSQLQALDTAHAGDIRERLSVKAEQFLAEVGLGLHLAALLLQRLPASPNSTIQNKMQHAAASGLPPGALQQCLNSRIDVEIVAPELEQPVEAMKSAFIDRYIGLRGSIVRAATVAPLITEASFTCSRCNAEFMVALCEGRFEYPSSCPSKCRFARFTVNKSKSNAIDWQRIRLQEDFAELASSDGPSRRMPRTVDCDLKKKLVGSCVPGDAVVLYGIVRYMPTAGPMAGGKEGRQAPSRALYILYLEVKAVVNTRRAESSGGTAAEEEFSQLHLEFIREVHRERERLPLLVASFCPQIYGQHLVKAALILALLGGIPVRAPGVDQRLRRRGDIHVLLLGDPGLGKSELLRALARLNSRGVYVAGNSSSVAGLTASVVRDPSGEFALEAGALVLADNGLCCIDEFDKMGADQQALLEAMEQQTVSIAKAGIVCTLPARTTVVTAANPNKGTWDDSLTLAENLKGVMTEALLSRFDVVFLMGDDRNQQEDAALSRHIVQRRMVAGTGGLSIPRRATTDNDWANNAAAESDDLHTPLSTRLRSHTGQDNMLPQELLTTYIRYAKRYSQPRLGAEARQVVKDFYLKRRRADVHGMKRMPVTPRQLEALIRLSEARARAELRRVVRKDDVLDVIEIIEKGLEKAETLAVVSASKRKTPFNNLVDRIRHGVERRAQNGVREFSDVDLRKLAGEGVSEQDFEKAIRRLNEQENVLLVQGSGRYKFN